MYGKQLCLQFIKLNNLIAIVDRNNIQSDGFKDILDINIKAFGTDMVGKPSL